MYRSILLVTLTFIYACKASNTTPSNSPGITKFSDFSDYKGLDNSWYDGKAKVISFDLTQNRYADLHPGEAVLIQVTEPFNKLKQVKSDALNGHAVTTVMKTNLIERFTTGLYDYSVMTSVFTDVNPPFHTYKVTFTSQDWCGQSMSQLNLDNDHYNFMLRSYFESEGDKDVKVPTAILEDEIFNLIRIGASNIVNGNQKIIPSLKTIRLMHIDEKPIDADISITVKGDTTDMTINFPTINKKKTIHFASTSPHAIYGWEESYPSAFDQQVRSTKALKKGQSHIDYWRKNALADSTLRQPLDLLTY